MIIDLILIGGGIAYAFNQTDKSAKIDEKALKKYGQAFEKSKKAEAMVKEKKEYADKRLQNIVKKKRTIIERTYPLFAEVYQDIKKINIKRKNEITESIGGIKVDREETFHQMTLASKIEFTDKELIFGVLQNGIFKMMVKDSERMLSAASSQKRMANVEYSNAENICTIYDGIISKADNYATLLKNINFLFLKIISMTKELIEKNGYNVKRYSKFEESVLMTCENVAIALSELIKAPLFDEKGEFAQCAIETINKGKNYMQQMNDIIRQYEKM